MCYLTVINLLFFIIQKVKNIKNNNLKYNKLIRNKNIKLVRIVFFKINQNNSIQHLYQEDIKEIKIKTKIKEPVVFIARGVQPQKKLYKKTNVQLYICPRNDLLNIHNATTLI